MDETTAFDEGDQVRCPSGKAMGCDTDGDATGVGTVRVFDPKDNTWLVAWPSGDMLWHRAKEIVLAGDADDVSLAVGDRVRCPTGKSIATEFVASTADGAVGVVTQVDQDNTAYVRWPDGKMRWHYLYQLYHTDTPAPPPFARFDSVTCPTGRARGHDADVDTGHGIILRHDPSDDTYYVAWKEAEFWHRPDELQRTDALTATPGTPAPLTDEERRLCEDDATKATAIIRRLLDVIEAADAFAPNHNLTECDAYTVASVFLRD